MKTNKFMTTPVAPITVFKVMYIVNAYKSESSEDAGTSDVNLFPKVTEDDSLTSSTVVTTSNGLIVFCIVKAARCANVMTRTARYVTSSCGYDEYRTMRHRWHGGK